MILPSFTSRNLNVPVVFDAADRQLYEIREPLTRRIVAGVVEVTLTGSDTLHTLAFSHYGNAQLWWAIADYNDIFDPVSELRPGLRLLVPPLDLIDAYLSGVR